MNTTSDAPVWSPDGMFAVLYRYRKLEPFVQEDSLNLIDRQSGTIKEVYRFGPSDNEWTILVPAIERGGRYLAGVFAEAESRRRIILDDRSRRRELKDDND